MTLVGSRPALTASDTVGLIEPRVPAARAGDPGWAYQQRTSADLDGDGVKETAVLISDVALDARGVPMWEHGHRWQVYVEEDDGGVTRLYARFLNGKLTADLVAPDTGSRPTIALLQQTPHSLALYEVRYDGPRRIEVLTHFQSRLDPNWFVGSPRP